MKLGGPGGHCSACGGPVKRIETASQNLPNSRGMVLSIRRWKCRDCGRKVFSYDVVIGETTKSYGRPNPKQRRDAEPRTVRVVDGDGELLFKIIT